jgi:nitrite reductase/ring-hydroxylating ferredoxin subunit
MSASSSEFEQGSAAAAMYDDLVRVGPGSTMGEFMRQYWIPAAVSSELVAGGDPVRLVLLGERLIAVRDSSGKVGVMDHRCPHRNASLFLARNEDGGIRCVYHGWKFAVDGACLEQPNLPPENQFCGSVRAKAYPTVERAGVVWTYMGPRAEAPPFPLFEVATLSDDDVRVMPVMRECNWLQALEGDIDTSHFGFLHLGHVKPEDLPEGSPFRFAVEERAPKYHVRDTPWGTSYGAYRSGGPGMTYWRFANFLFPFWTQQPAGLFQRSVHARAWIPLDDHHTMFMDISWKDPVYMERMARAMQPADGAPPLEGLALENKYVPNTTDWLGRWRLAADQRNDWEIDRIAQREGRIFTGIANIHLQDQAITESMGPITDFENEHLAASDRMIARTRRRVVEAARAFRDDGIVPPGVDDPEVFFGSRSGNFVAPDELDWVSAYDQQLAAAERPGLGGDGERARAPGLPVGTS